MVGGLAEPEAVGELGDSDDDLGSDLGEEAEDLVVVGEPNDEV